MLFLATSKGAALVAALTGCLVLSSAHEVDTQPLPAGDHLYRMTWDDRIDGALDEARHEAWCQLGHANGKLSGRFVGEVAGTERAAVLTGESFAAGALATLQQHEEGYVCTYQLQPRGVGVYLGTWRDTKGRSGEVRLARVE